jgi:hypothetical protein
MIRPIQAVIARHVLWRTNIARARCRIGSGTLAWLRYPALLTIAALLMMGVTGCSQHRLIGACGVVVDGSGSGNATTGFDASGQLHNQLSKFLTTTGCRYVVFAPINGASQQSFCSEPELDMDPDIQGAVDRQTLHQEAFAAAMQRSEAMLKCARSDKRSIPNASDILGGLARIAQERPSVPGPYSVLVVSDFRNWSRSLELSRENLTTQASRTALINKLASEGLVPNFHDAPVYTAGFGVLQSKNPARFPAFRAFWVQFMSRAHAQFHPDASG